jgi:hypothetical protein
VAFFFRAGASHRLRLRVYQREGIDAVLGEPGFALDGVWELAVKRLRCFMLTRPLRLLPLERFEVQRGRE